MTPNWRTIPGTVQQGHGIASGQAAASPYPQGSIAMQAPIFKTLGLDLSIYYPGTLNLSIHPYTFEMRSPTYTFRHVQWTSQHPPEDFSFSLCRVTFKAQVYEGLIYYPHPETKRTHFQDPSTLEILTVPIASIQYGDRLDVSINPEEILIFNP